MKRIPTLALAVLVLGLSAVPMAAHDSTPQRIKVQGFLSDKTGGTPVAANGIYSMTFGLYDAESNGTLTQTAGPLAVTVTDGLYEVELPFPTMAFDGTERYIEITVDDEMLSPRIRLVSTPFAYMADRLDGFEGADLDESAEIQDVETSLQSAVANLQGQIDDLVTTGGNTLDEAYDEGGAGAGSEIVADSGPVRILGGTPSAPALEVDGSVSVSQTLITPGLKASDDDSLATIDFDSLPNDAQNSGITIGKARAVAGQNNGQPYVWIRANGAHSWILDHTSPGTLWAQSVGAYYNNIKQGNIGFFGAGPTVDYLSVGFGGAAWWNERSKFVLWKSGRAQFMPSAVGSGSGSQVEPTAWLVLAPGSSTPNSAPLKFRAGTTLLDPEPGAMEWDGTDLYMTDDTSTRRKIAFATGGLPSGENAWTAGSVDGGELGGRARSHGMTGSQVIVTGITQDPVTKDVTVRTRTIVVENGLITRIE
jgi:hypothetical protein